MKYTSSDEAQTRSIGRQLASVVLGGEVITLSGDLGVGKTVFAKGFAEGIGISDIITSPTFTIMNLYRVDNDSDIKKFVHVDTYRLEKESELLDIGIEDYLYEKDTVVLIEWPEKIASLLEKKTIISVLLTQKNNNERYVTIEGIR